MKFLVVLILLFLAYKALVRNTSIKMYRNFQQRNPGSEIKPEGTVTIVEAKKKNRSFKSEDGEFTDYEEIKD
jgi:hypothetical protein